jgi:hypothetical protein
MNTENTQKLFNDFPTFFKPERPVTEALMAFGFECGDGWFDLIYKLCEEIAALKPDDFEVFQVKEKFGGLRFYLVSGASDEIHSLITKAEERSYHICENCGADVPNGPSKKGGWISTKCEKCEK